MTKSSAGSSSIKTSTYIYIGAALAVLGAASAYAWYRYNSSSPSNTDAKAVTPTEAPKVSATVTPVFSVATSNEAAEKKSSATPVSTTQVVAHPGLTINITTNSAAPSAASSPVDKTKTLKVSRSTEFPSSKEDDGAALAKLAIAGQFKVPTVQKDIPYLLQRLNAYINKKDGKSISEAKTANQQLLVDLNGIQNMPESAKKAKKVRDVIEYVDSCIATVRAKNPPATPVEKNKQKLSSNLPYTSGYEVVLTSVKGRIQSAYKDLLNNPHYQKGTHSRRNSVNA